MDFFNKLAEQFIKANRRLKKWQRVVSALAAVVVFVTTYAMVLPAITLDKETASAQAGIEIAASENDPESGGTVYEAESAEESLEVLSEEEPEEEKPATESSDTESESREAEVSGEQDEGPEEDNSGENTETEDDQSTEAEYLPNDTDAAYDTKKDAASETLTNENAEEENSAEEVHLITEETQLIYEYIDEEYENGIEDENEDGIDDGYFVYAEFGADAKLPEGVELTAEEITKESDPEVYEAYYEKALSGLQDKYDENTELSFAKFYDIRFVYNGEEIEPSGDVKVRIEYKKAVEIEKETNVDAVHFDKNNEEEPEVIDSEVNKSENEKEQKDKDDTVKTVEFESDQFSVYGIIGSYTVDFHWEVDGNVYEYSLAGGDSVSFRELVEMLHVIDEEAGSDNTAEEAVKRTVDELINDIEDIRLSKEGLVEVVRIEEEITAGGLKEELGLECEYSAELTDAQRTVMDSKVFSAPDWALISLKAFDTEEYLTVELKTGESFQIRVTDAQIRKDYVSASGETYTITVTYGEEAEIPDGAELEVEEILPGTEDYYRYMQLSVQKLGFEAGGLSFARYFDITIVDEDGNKVEPKTPVQVEIAYKDGVEIGEDQSLSIVHFAENGTEIISDVSVSEDGREIDYVQSGFSVTGTIVGKPSNGQRRMIVLKDGNRYYIVNNDASLTEVGYDEATGTVSVVEPMLWTFGGNNIYFNSEASGFNENQTASDWFRRYLDPSSASGTTEEVKAGTAAADEPGYVGVTVTKTGEWTNIYDHNNVVEINSITNRQTAVSQTSVTIDSADGVSTIRHGSDYFGIERDENGTPVRLVPQTGEIERAQFIFAEASKVPSGVHLQNAVDHIDISIQGGSAVKVPLAYGTYYKADGSKVEILTNTNVLLGPDQAVDPDDLKITAEDMKRAMITAYDKNGNELDDAFYITGFSQNASTSLSTPQVRIEGAFKVAQPEKDNPAYKTIDGNLYDGNWWTWTMPDTNYVNAVRQARLNNIIDYRLTVVKPVTYQLVDTEGNPLYVDKEHTTPLYVSVDVAFTGTFNYWDYGESEKNSGNECPPLENNPAWRAGDIPNHDLSGMDFVLKGTANEADSPLCAIEIMKRFVDEKGNLIILGEPVTNTVSIYENKDADRNGVKDYKIDPINGENPNRDNDEGLYEDYTPLRDHNITVEAGSAQALIYDYNVTNAMYYITEHNTEQELPDTITDSNHEEWKYVKTYIQTEYVRRGYGGYDDINNYPNPLHTSDDYYRGDEYKSSPEVVGWFKPVTGDVKKSGFLEYFVYNVYSKGKMLEVEKKWLPKDGTIPEGAEVTVDLYYAQGQNGQFPDRDEYQKVTVGQGPFDSDLKTTMTLRADNDWKGVFEGLPETMTEGGTVYDLDYYAKEVSVKIPGNGETEINENAIDITNAYNASISINSGKETITNEREEVSLDADKKWAEGTQIPDGTEVTFELTYAARTAVTAEGAAIAESERFAWPDKSAYTPVKGTESYAAPFINDPGIDESKIVTELKLDAGDAVGEVWHGVFMKLPKYLIAQDGSILEVDYCAVETAVKIPASGRTVVDEEAEDVTDEYYIVVEKEDSNNTGSDGKVTITNELNETSLELQKSWSKGTEVPVGTKVKAELRFAARMVKGKDGQQIATPAAWPEYTAYKAVTNGQADALTTEETGNAIAVTGLTIKSQVEVELGVNADNIEKSWRGSFTGLPRYLSDSEGNVWELDYYAVETAVNVPSADSTVENRIADYIHTEVKSESSAQDPYTSDGSVLITNKENIVIDVRKEWNPSTPPEGGEATVQLKRYKMGQTPDQIKTSLTVVKVWDDANNQDGKRPSELEITLTGGQTTKTVTLNEDNGWTSTVNGLQAYAQNGDAISYTWTEGQVPQGYSLTGTVTLDGVTTLTNSYTPGKTSATVRIDWQDGDNRDTYRPESIVATLDQNGQKVTLNAGNDWTATISGLPEYQNGSKINYTWTADAWTTGNQTKYTGDGKSVQEGEQQSKITYVHEPEKTTMKVRIIWDDNNNQDGSRPEGVHMTIVDYPSSEVLLTSADSWEGSLELFKNENGQPISYSWNNPIIAGYTQTDKTTEPDGTVVMTYYHEPIPPKDYVTVTVYTILREAREGYYTNWETNGWSTNIYNLNATYEGNNVTMSTIEADQGDPNLHWNDQSHTLRAPLHFNVDKNSPVSFHIDVGGNGVSLVDIGANGSTLTQNNGATSSDVSFAAGTTDVDLYVVLQGTEEKLPEYSTVYMVVGTSGEFGVAKDPTNAIKKITVPVNTEVAFNYDSYYSSSWNQTIDPKYEVFYWHDTQYQSKWEAVSPGISGDGAPDEDIVFNVGMKERYLILLKADPSFQNNLNCKLVSLAAGTSASANPLSIYSMARATGNVLLRSFVPDRNSMQGGTRKVLKAAKNDTDGDPSDHTADGDPNDNTTNGDPNDNTGGGTRGDTNPGNAILSSPVTVPDGYVVDTAFNDPAVTLTLKDAEGYGWEQSFPAQEKYDQWGREYIYYVEEIDFKPGDYTTESITGDPNNGETVVITNKKTVVNGSVKVTKAFGGIDSLPDGFTITASYSDTSGDHTVVLTTSTAGMTGTGSSNDPYTWTLNEIPVGTLVTFTETGFTKEGYTVTINGSATASPVTATAAETVGTGSTAEFVNAYTKNPGDLELTKLVDGEGADANKEFEFSIALTPPSGQTLDSSYTASLTGDDTVTTATVTDGIVSGIKIKAGQTYKIHQLPVDTAYVITETDYGEEGYTPTVTSGSLSGTITGGTETTAVTVTNSYSAVDITVVKIDETTRNKDNPSAQKKLPNAKFKLFKLTTPAGGGTETYTVYPNAENCEKITGADGTLKYEKLPNGRYKIEETGAPDGYITKQTMILYFTVSAGSTVIWTNSEGTEISAQNMVEYEPSGKTFTVGNEPGTALPNTGGPGTIVFTTLGSILIAGTGFLLWRRRRLS